MYLILKSQNQFSYRFVRSLKAYLNGRMGARKLLVSYICCKARTIITPIMNENLMKGVKGSFMNKEQTNLFQQ